MATLKGKDLLRYLDEHQGEDRDKVIEGAGYVIRRNGRLSLQRTKFFEALAAANGHELGPVLTERSEGGKEATYRLKVGPKGLVPVSRAYTDQCGMKPGSYVRVVVEENCIVLEPDDDATPVATPPVASLATIA
jgi:hypothetical protein